MEAEDRTRLPLSSCRAFLGCHQEAFAAVRKTIMALQKAAAAAAAAPKAASSTGPHGQDQAQAVSSSARALLVCAQETDCGLSLQEAAAAAAAAPAGSKTPRDKDKAIKELIKGIPREQQAVFAYSLKWDAFDDNADALLPKLSKWVCL